MHPLTQQQRDSLVRGSTAATLLQQDEYEWFAKECQDRISAMSSALANGSCDSWDTYQHTTGIIEGIRLALTIPHEAVAEAETTREETTNE